MTTNHHIRLGTRASPLARWQAEWVAGQLRAEGVVVELVPITTQGDAVQTGPIGAIGTQGVFTKEIQRALLDRRIDLAVHSLKDLPTDPVEGLCLAAVPPRESAGDALVCRVPIGSAGGPHGQAALVHATQMTFDALPQAAAIGTGSVRRRAQLWHARPDLRMEDVRGNVDTRLRKLDEGQYDALVLAEAGLRRLGLSDRITQTLPKSLILPAVGQGALGLETRDDDADTRGCLVALDDPATHAAVLAERALLAALRGGCLAPVGAWGRIEQDGQLHLTAAVMSGDGRTRLTATAAGAPVDAATLGRQAADDLLRQGAADLIQQARTPRPA